MGFKRSLVRIQSARFVGRRDIYGARQRSALRRAILAMHHCPNAAPKQVSAGKTDEVLTERDAPFLSKTYQMTVARLLTSDHSYV